MENEKVPAVSICIPTYKQITYLKILLDSIQQQTYRNFEIVVSDDSPDETVADLLRSYSFTGILSYHKNLTALGSPRNWNACINRAKGRYIKIMHHDDAFASPDSLDKMVNALEKAGADFMFSATKVINVKNPSLSRIHTIKKPQKIFRNPSLLFFGNSIGAPSALLLKKSLTNLIKYNPDYIWLVDIEYYLRLFRETSNGIILNEPLILTHDAADHQLTTRIMSEYEIQIQEQAAFYEKTMPGAGRATRFFMQIFFLRLVLKHDSRALNKKQYFVLPPPALVRFYTRYSGNKLLLPVFYIFVRVFDFLRKKFY